MMISFIRTSNGLETIASDDEFANLSKKIQDEILAAATITSEADGNKKYVVADVEIGESIARRIRKREEREISSWTRRFNEHHESAGTYKTADIDAIFDAQDGQCYFSGEELCKAPKNFAIDHINPVRSGGSFWPGNLALVLTEINQEKHGHSPRKYWSMLEQKFGGKWVSERKLACKLVDARRKKIDAQRRAAVKSEISRIEKQLQRAHPKLNIVYDYEGDQLWLSVDGICVQFPAGILRANQSYRSVQYLAGIIASLRAIPTRRMATASKGVALEDGQDC